jgi:hypothetical protein
MCCFNYYYYFCINKILLSFNFRLTIFDKSRGLGGVSQVKPIIHFYFDINKFYTTSKIYLELSFYFTELLLVIVFICIIHY